MAVITRRTKLMIYTLTLVSIFILLMVALTPSGSTYHERAQQIQALNNQVPAH